MNIKYLIIIGSGRSGSTLLCSIFNSNQNVSSIGETNFLVPKLYNLLKNNKLLISGINEWHNHGNHTYPWTESHLKFTDQTIKDIVNNLIPHSEETKYLLFKDIWNGHSGFGNYEYKIYNEVLENCEFIWVVRNPIDVMNSIAGFTQKRMNFLVILRQLTNWRKINLKIINEIKDPIIINYDLLLKEPKIYNKYLKEKLKLEKDFKIEQTINGKIYVPSKEKKKNLLTNLLFKLDRKTYNLWIEINKLSKELLDEYR